ncbi:MAG: ABC transporter substrate-binding protein, partial [Desulfatiglandales bacterium]
LLFEGPKELLSKGVDVLVGPIGGDQVAALKARLKEEGINLPVYAFTQRAELAEREGRFYCALISPLDQLAGLLKKAIRDLRIENYAIIYPETPYGKVLVEKFKEAAIYSGGVIKLEASFNLDGIDLGRYEGSLRGVDAIFIPDTLNGVGMVLAELGKMGISQKVVLSSDFLNPKDLTTTLRANNFKGLIATAIYPTTIPEGIPISGIGKRFYEASGKDPSLFGISSYWTLLSILRGEREMAHKEGASFDQTGRIKAPTYIFWVTEKASLRLE